MSLETIFRIRMSVQWDRIDRNNRKAPTTMATETLVVGERERIVSRKMNKTRGVWGVGVYKPPILRNTILSYLRFDHTI